MKEQIVESISNNCKEKINEMNKWLDRKLNQIMNKKVSDSGSNMMTKNSEEIINNKVSGNYSNESNIEVKSENNNDIIKNVVLESKVVNIESDNEDSVEVGFSNGLLASINEIERECDERLGGQRADFPQVYSEMEFSQVLYEDRVSSRGCVGDMVSQNGPLVFVVYLVKPGGVIRFLLCPLHVVK